MFNAPRPSQPRYSTTNGGSFVDQNPLAASMYSDYGEVDPWSTPASPPPPQLPSVLDNILEDASLPPIYRQAFDAVHSGTEEVSLTSLIRVVSASKLPASTTDRIVNLVSSKPRVSRLEFYVALALVGLAQEGGDISVEQVAQRALDNSLPQPTLDIVSLSVPSISPARSTSPPIPSYSQAISDPWSYNGASTSTPAPAAEPVLFNVPALSSGGAPTALTGELGKYWWKTESIVEVSMVPEKQGFILARYNAYLVQHSDHLAPVMRRYSEFAYLFDCLIKRYPFRIIPSLPPKRLGGDGQFLEQRRFEHTTISKMTRHAFDILTNIFPRRGLQRFLRYVANHPVIKHDGLLTVFFTEQHLEAWRKHSAISLEEESVHKRVDSVEEMSIPRDLADKIETVRGRMAGLIDQWSRICTIAERILKRSEASASDLSRMTMTINGLIEDYPESWRAPSDEYYEGIRQGLRSTSKRLTIFAEASERRTRSALLTSLEALKTQRDLYIATRDLFLRHDRLSGDRVDRLKKRIEVSSLKLEGIKQTKKDGWVAEADKILGLIEMDQSSIAAALARRVFIRHSIWHELRVVLYNRENTLLAVALQTFAREERNHSGSMASNWATLSDDLRSMPIG